MVLGQLFLTLTININKIKNQSYKIDITRFIINQTIIIYNFFYLKYFIFIDIVDQNSISKTVTRSKNAYILGRRK